MTDDFAFVLVPDGKKAFNISRHATKTEAVAAAQGEPGAIVVEAADDLSTLYGPTLVGLYNELRDSKLPAVARFATAKDARKRVMARLHLYTLTSEPVTVTIGAEPQNQATKTETQPKEATIMATKTKKAAKKVAAKKTAKKSTAPRGKGKSAGKAGDFTQVRAGTTRANILKEMTGTKTAEQIGAKLGIDKSLVGSNVFCLWRDCAIGYSYGPKGELTALFPTGKKMADAFKPAAK